MRSRHYTVLISRQDGGSYTRVKLSRTALWTGAAALVLVPILMGAVAVGVVQAELRALRSTNAALLAENDEFQATALDLSDHVAELRAAIGEIGTRAQLDPVTEKALSRLPAVVRTSAVGGMSPVVARPEETLGRLGDLLDLLGDRLVAVRTSAERQRALAFATPMLWPVSGWLSSSFGSRDDPFTGDADFHRGVDISALKGTPVFATADGKVRAAGFNGAYGKSVMIDHGFGIATRFGHLSGFAVTVGQAVRRGDVIGYVGSTGRATSPHLHYEILLNGRAVNPWPLLNARP